MTQRIAARDCRRAGSAAGQAPVGAWAVCAAIAVLAGACSENPRMVVLADPRWWEAVGTTVEPALGRLARRRSLGLEVRLTAETGVPQALLRRPPRLLLVGPTTAPSAAALAEALPGTLVVAPGPASAPSARPANLVLLRYAPQEAFKEAGRLAAAAGGVCPVGILAPAGSSGAAAFRSAFEAAGSPQRLRERAVPPNADRARLRAAVDELYAEGVRLFLVALRTLTPACLELLEGRDCLAVVEAQESSGAFAEVVQASVEPDWARAVESVLDRQGEAPSPALAARLVVSERGEAGWLCRGAEAPAATR